MNKNLTPGLAWRYLSSKKSHNAVGAISAVAIVGMAVATAAIICVLSVFNGFHDSIEKRLDAVSPDILISPKSGKTISDVQEICTKISKIKDIALATPTITDNALALCETVEMPVTLKGVDFPDYLQIANLDSLSLTGDLLNGITGDTYVSVGAASGLHAYPGDDILLFAPKRFGRVNLSNPSASFRSDSTTITSIFRTNQKRFDENLIFTTRERVAQLFDYEDEASAIEIQLIPNSSVKDVQKRISNLLGEKFSVKNRLEQQEMDFRMIKIEKWITFLLLFLILIIASFNVISSMSMLVIEKENSFLSLRALGMPKTKIGDIFFWESIYVCTIGGGAGIILGVLLSLAQQIFGFIKIGGDPDMVIMNSYPVKVEAFDILLTILPIALIGLTTAAITASYARKKINQ